MLYISLYTNIYIKRCINPVTVFKFTEYQHTLPTPLRAISLWETTPKFLEKKCTHFTDTKICSYDSETALNF